MNDRPDDGTAVSWIWDGDFEKLVSLTTGRPVILSGIRVEDLSTRFEVAGLAKNEQVLEQDLSKLADLIKQAPTHKVYILATYTATLDLRHVLAEQGYLKEGKSR